MGKSGARSAGPIGWPVPGWSTGAGGTGRSATMLYQARGMRSSSSTYFVRSLVTLASWVGWSRARHGIGARGGRPPGRVRADARLPQRHHGRQALVAEGRDGQRPVLRRPAAQHALVDDEAVHGPGGVEAPGGSRKRLDGPPRARDAVRPGEREVSPERAILGRPAPPPELDGEPSRQRRQLRDAGAETQPDDARPGRGRERPGAGQADLERPRPARAAAAAAATSGTRPGAVAPRKRIVR